MYENGKYKMRTAETTGGVNVISLLKVLTLKNTLGSPSLLVSQIQIV